MIGFPITELFDGSLFLFHAVVHSLRLRKLRIPG
jgi:hypothetical protein